MKKFICPTIPRGEIFCAVYKMIFDDGSYYIGSTINLTQRINGWRFKLNSGIDKNYRVTAAYKETSTVTFEILEIIDDPVFRKFREDGYIKINFGKPLCLNIASNSINNLGIKQNPNKKVYKGRYKAVVKIDDLGRVIETYESVADACRKNKTNDVSECFKNALRKVNGMMFREVDKGGNVIPAPFIPKKDRKPVVRKKGYKISKDAIRNRLVNNQLKRESVGYKPPIHAKKIIQMDTNGNVIKEHLSIQSAARLYNGDTRNFKRQIKKSPRNYYKGYIWKYA